MNTINRQRLSTVCYMLALLISLSNLFAILYIHRAPLLTGRGMGSFVVPWFLLYAVPATGIWWVGRALAKNSRLSIAYWVSIGAMVALLLIVPIKFYID
jgi:hypothetical protein